MNKVIYLSAFMVGATKPNWIITLSSSVSSVCTKLAKLLLQKNNYYVIQTKSSSTLQHNKHNAKKFSELLEIYPLNLSLHNEEDEGKTEDPTPSRLRKAREEEGQVYSTSELPQSMVILVGIVSLFFLSSFLYRELQVYMSKYIENINQIEISANSISTLVAENVTFIAKVVLPISLILLVTAVFFTMIQTRFFVTAKNLRFNLSKIAPNLKNLKEKTILSQHQLLQAVKTIFKLGVVFAIVGGFIYIYAIDLWKLSKYNLYGAFVQTNLLLFEVSIYLGMFILIIAIPDWFLQRRQFIQKLKMTKDEVKKEIREMEGDPQIKQKQKERSRQLVMNEKDLQNRVATADVVITNPTHYACAISYDVGYMDAPKVVAKGVDKIAFKIRKIAEDNYITIVENRPLARALYAQVEIDEYIPKEFYRAISEIIAALDKFKEKFKTTS